MVAQYLYYRIVDFENDEEDVRHHLEESLDRLDKGLPVEPVDHAPGTGDQHSNVWGKEWFTRWNLPVGEAVANADLGFLGAPAPNPNLFPGEGSDYSTVRYAEGEYAYTVTTMTKSRCERCGRWRLRTFMINFVTDVGEKLPLGKVAACQSCDWDHWLIRQHLKSQPYRPFRVTSDSLIMFSFLIAVVIILFLLVA